MVGNATFTIVPSSTIISCAAHTSSSANQRLRSSLPGAGAPLLSRVWPPSTRGFLPLGPDVGARTHPLADFELMNLPFIGLQTSDRNIHKKSYNPTSESFKITRPAGGSHASINKASNVKEETIPLLILES